MAAPAIPPVGAFLPGAGTTASRCDFLEGLVAFLMVSLGGARDKLFTVSAGTITPDQMLCRVDTSGGGAVNLDTINAASLANANHLILRSQDATRVVTVRSGTGNLSLAGGVNMVLDHPTALLWLHRSASGWTELFRWYGRSQAGGRAWLGLGSAATKEFATLAEHEAGASLVLPATPGGVAWMMGDADLVIGDRDLLGSFSKTAEVLLKLGSSLYRAPLSLVLQNSFAGAFTSGELAIANAGGSSGIAHGLGAIPRSWEVILRCKTAELGYAVGEELPYRGDGLQVRADATNLAYRFAATANPVSILHASTGVMTAVTNGSWRALVRVFA